jgi:hypothetical protein
MHHVSDGCHVTIRIPLIPSLFFSHWLIFSVTRFPMERRHLQEVM